MILTLKNEPHLRLIEPSRFLIALDSIKNGDSCIISYLDAIDIAGSISPYLAAEGLLYYYNDISEYFIKRILIFDLYEWQK